MSKIFNIFLSGLFVLFLLAGCSKEFPTAGEAVSVSFDAVGKGVLTIGATQSPSGCSSAGYETTDIEQYAIELLNKDRIAASSMPVAVQNCLVNSSRNEAKRRLFNPTDPIDPLTRARNAGYDAANRSAFEGFGIGTGGCFLGDCSANDWAKLTKEDYDQIMSDPIKRAEMLSNNYAESGSGIATGIQMSPDNEEIYYLYGITDLFTVKMPSLPTHNYFFTGVVYNDKNGDDSYTPGVCRGYYSNGACVGSYTAGEGIANVTVTATESDGTKFVTTTGMSGGYSIETYPFGVYKVVASGGFGEMQAPDFYDAERNVKIDFVPGSQGRPGVPFISLKINNTFLQQGVDSVSIKWKVNDSENDIINKRINITIDGANVFSSTDDSRNVVLNPSQLGIGLYNVVVTAKDAKGNSAKKSDFFSVSDTATRPDIKANGVDTVLNVKIDNKVNITYSLVVGSYLRGKPAEQWIIANKAKTWYYYDPAWGGSWKTVTPKTPFKPSYKGALYNVPLTTVFKGKLPATGYYTFYYGYDLIMDGKINQDKMNYDKVGINVTR